MIVHKDVLYQLHRILPAGTFNTTFVKEIILKLPQLNHSTEVNAKCRLMDKLLNYDLILGRDILHQLGIIFDFENKTTNWQKVSISMKPPNCNAIIKESCPVRNATKRIKQI